MQYRFAKLLIGIVLSCLLATSYTEAQSPRAYVQLDVNAATSSSGASVHTIDDLSVAAWVDHSTQNVYVSTSDGRGIEWSAPARVDNDVSSAAKTTTDISTAVVLGHLVISWMDERHGNTEVYVNISPDGGTTWNGEQLVDKGYASGTGTVTDYDTFAEVDPMDDQKIYIHFGLLVEPTAGTNRELYYTSSADAGTTWRPAAYVPQEVTAGDYDIETFDLNGHDRHVSIVWTDARSGGNKDVWFQHSHHHGMMWNADDRPMQQNGVGTTNVTENLHVEVDGSTLVVVWTEMRTGSAPEVRCNVSYNSGDNWYNPDVSVGGYTAGTDTCMGPVSGSNSSVLSVAWADDRNGTNEVYVATSLDGLTWTEFATGREYLGNLKFTRVKDTGYMMLTWEGVSGIEAVLSRDTNQTYGSAFVISDTPTATAQQMAYNNSYQNFLVAWDGNIGSYDHVYIGGVRPQTLLAQGTFSAGNIVNFAVEGWNSIESGWAFGVLVSGATGSYMIPGDGHNTGLLQDAYLNQALMQIPGLLSGLIDGNGTGSTPSFPLPGSIPGGTSLYCVGVAGQLIAPGTYLIGGITDILEVPVN